MKIYSINSCGSCYNFPSSRNAKINNSKLSDLVDGRPPEQPENPSFKGIGGATGAVVGTLAGIGLGTLLTIGTAGLAAPLVISIFGCAAGAIGGDVIESKIKKPSEKSVDDNDENINIGDFYDGSYY